jgi:hypothetical protein
VGPFVCSLGHDPCQPSPRAGRESTWERDCAGIEEVIHHDASRSPVSTASAGFCGAPATASRFA